MLIHSKRIIIPEGCVDAVIKIEIGKIVDF